MLKHVLLAALLALSATGDLLAEGARPRIPELSGYFLDGDRVSIPADLTEPLTLLVITYDDPGSEAFESWQAVAAGFDGDLTGVFVVLLGERGGIDRAMTAGRLRRNVRAPALRASMVPVFQEAGVLRTQLGIDWNSPVIALLVTETGEIVWHQAGGASPTSPGEIRSRLDRAPAPEFVEQPAGVEPEAAPAVTEAPEPEPETAPASAPTNVFRDPPSQASAASEHLPVIEGVTLSGRKRRLPVDLGEIGTRLVLLPRGGAGDALQTVLSQMEEDETDPSDWLVLVFKGRSAPFGKAFASGKLRAEIPSAMQREHVLPLYMELAAFESHFGLPPTDKPRFIIMNKSGRVSKAECLGQVC
jgi:hypothetical protein